MKMNLTFSKYKCRFSTILISVYLISLLAGILHYHHVSISSIEHFNEQTENDATNYPLQLDTNFNCVIQQNFKNIQTASLIFNNVSLHVYDDGIYYRKDIQQFQLKPLSLSDTLLRAPPSIS